MNIAGLSIKRPVFIIMLVLTIITLGLIGYSTLSWDLMPNIEFPTVSVMVVYPGASAEEMETLVAKPLEDAFSTLEGLDKITTSCREGLAMINVEFGIGTDVKFSEIKVRDKVAATKPILPDDIQEPIIQKFNFSDIPIQFMSLSGKRSSADLRDILEYDIKPQLERIPGVASIRIFGGQERIVKIELNKAILQAKGISISTITNAIKARNLNYPIGTIEGVEKNITVRIQGEFKDTDEIARLPISSTNGKIVRIGDVAKVSFGLDDEVVDVRVNKVPAVMFSVQKQSGTNSVEVANRVLKAINDIQKKLPADIKLASAGDTTAGIKRNIEGLRDNIVLGAILAVLVVWIFLGNFRSAIITAVALPDSIIGAFFIMMVAGFSMNVITLLSLSLAVGLLIDDSIVVRENIFRHIEEGMKPKEAAEKGTNEVALAVISTTLSIMSVFLPISFLSGMIGQFFKQFGLTVAFALAISLLDAFTTAPMLSAYWYKESDPSKRRGFLKWIYDLSESWNRFYAELNKYYRKILNWSLERKKFIIVMSVALFIGSIVISLPFIGKRFMYADSGMIMANIETYSGAPLNKMSGYMSMIEDFLSKEPDIESYFVMAGANMNGNIGTNLGSLMISMKPLSKRKLTTDQMKDKLRKYVTDNKLDRFINLSISSGMGGGSSESYTPVLINITGEDLKELEKIATQVKNIVLETPGSADVEISMKPGTPEVVLKVDVVKAEKVGITTAEIAGVVRNMIQGTTVSNFRKGEKQYDIKMRLDKNDRKTINDLKNIILTTHMGRKIPLTSVADFVYGSGPTEIRRENKARIVKVSANIAPGANMGTVNSKIKQRIYKEIILPRGYYISMGGQSKEFASLVKEMLKAIFLALLFMYMILASLYNSILQPLYIMVAIPLAIIGSFLALLITGYDLDTFGFIGILMVLGLVAKNGILLLDFINKKREQGMDIRESILQAAPIRLRPILMTSFAMIAGMLPIAMSLGEGSKGREGLAIVVIGGLLTSTFLTLVVVPVVYEYFEKRISAWQKTKASSANIKRKK